MKPNFPNDGIEIPNGTVPVNMEVVQFLKIEILKIILY